MLTICQNKPAGFPNQQCITAAKLRAVCDQTDSAPGVQGWHRGETTRLPPMWPRFDFQTQHYMWVEFVGSLL